MLAVSMNDINKEFTEAEVCAFSLNGHINI